MIRRPSRRAFSRLGMLLPMLVLVPFAQTASQGPPTSGEPALVGLDHFVGEPRVVSVGDVDQDGIPDLLVHLGFLWQKARLDLLRGRGDGSFEPSEPVMEFGYSGGLRFTRLVHADGDGILDLIEFLGGIDKSRVHLGVGDGTFLPPHMLPGRNLLRDADHFATADFNLDGRQDFVVTGQAGSTIGGTSSTTIFVYVGGPNGAYSGPQGGSIGQFAGLGALTTGDYDGDGLPDVLASVKSVMSSAPDAGLWMLRGDGAGSLVVSTPVVTPLDTLPLSMVTQDFDGDGHLDVAALDTMPGTLQPAVRLLKGDGTGRFTMSGWLTVDAPAHQTNMYAGRLLAADVDGDGLTDLVAVPETSATLSLFRGLGAGQFAPSTTHALGGEASAWPATLRHADAADLDHDGRADVVVSHLIEGTIRTLRSGSAPFVSLGLGQPRPLHSPVLAAHGTTVPGATLRLQLSAVPQASQGLLFFGLSTSVQPVLGLQFAVPTGAALPVAGNVVLNARWPIGLEPGDAVYVQAVLIGPGGPSTSNVLALLASP